MTIETAWECERSVEADVPVSFAWQFMSDLRNWSDPPAEFSLDGPFADGSTGTTRMPGRPPATWTLRDVKPGRAYTIEGGSFLERAQFMVFWRFDPTPDDADTADGASRRECRRLRYGHQGGVRAKPGAGHAEDRGPDGGSVAGDGYFGSLIIT